MVYNLFELVGKYTEFFDEGVFFQGIFLSLPPKVELEMKMYGY